MEKKITMGIQAYVAGRLYFSEYMLNLSALKAIFFVRCRSENPGRHRYEPLDLTENAES